ncbi:hypothetical protein HDV00_004262 [Rhizophlyctis rosea]|nr:hypothetical protein HDV00_004262 [Rhizophlyctis rosea]
MDMVGVQGEEAQAKKKKVGKMKLRSGVEMTVEESIEAIKRQLADRANVRAGRSIAALGRRFRDADPTGRGAVDRFVFGDVLERDVPGLGEENINRIITFLDPQGTDTVPYGKFIDSFRGGEMDSRRNYVCDQSFAKLDKEGKGYITVRDLRAAFDPSVRTDWSSGAKSREQVFREELDAGFDGMQRITREDYRTYWHNRGATIEDDKAFSMLVFTTFPTKYRHGCYRSWREGPSVGWA